jgi:cellulose synthase (UDP-forming)
MRAGIKVRPWAEVAASCLGLCVTAWATFQAGSELLVNLQARVTEGRWGAVALHLLFCAIVVALLYGGIVYQVTRALYYRRRALHAPTPAAELEEVLACDSHPLVTILVPSFREEPPVVMRTLLAAALQTWPNRRVVLLIDDPPQTGSPAERSALAQSRALVGRVEEMLREPREWIAAAGETDSAPEVAELLRRTATWFDELAGRFDPGHHEEAFFVQEVLATHATACRDRAATLGRVGAEDAALAVRSSRRFLQVLFSAELSAFERKTFVNLSHEANKAMNLNAYLGLVGGAFRFEERRDGRHLVPCPAERADLVVPDSPFVITLDADSLIEPDYALRLHDVLEAPGNERVAVVQTPYSAIPDAPGILERLAGATTDIQYIIHQGFTACGGTYWVGANALLRKEALDDIATRDVERGYPVIRYIQDRTVIEDTESSIDLVARGWSLVNFPERLAYSATPPDFGSLLIQRRRWANGGLIILPKLLGYLGRHILSPRIWAEGFVRIHYLASIALVNLGLLVVLAVPFTESIQSWWLPVTALPYYALYARDLKLCGYRYVDLFGVYALNLLLIPVNLGGVFKSLHQAWTGKKTPFARTPKVDGRTAVRPFYVIAVYVLIVQWFVAGGVDFAYGRTIHGSFAVLNAAFLASAAVVLVGLRESWADASLLWHGDPSRAEARRLAKATPAAQSAEGGKGEHSAKAVARKPSRWKAVRR